MASIQILARSFKGAVVGQAGSRAFGKLAASGARIFAGQPARFFQVHSQVIGQHQQQNGDDHTQTLHADRLAPALLNEIGPRLILVSVFDLQPASRTARQLGREKAQRSQEGGRKDGMQEAAGRWSPETALMEWGTGREEALLQSSEIGTEIY
jgi:hypothetical protein